MMTKESPKTMIKRVFLITALLSIVSANAESIDTQAPKDFTLKNKEYKFLVNEYLIIGIQLNNISYIIFI